jgi:hypothetical protein
MKKKATYRIRNWSEYNASLKQRRATWLWIRPASKFAAVYSLFGMGMQRVDAERMERLESSPLCVV